MALYKFRSLNNLHRFLDILINKRLYMAHYDEMNDPMEGAFFMDHRYMNLLNDIREGKRQQLICSLSKNYKNTLLWSHYADGHRGCCLEIDVISKLTPYDIVYSNQMPVAPIDSIEKILTHKSKMWEYEDEVRYFKSEKATSGHRAQPWLKVKINKVYLGYKMSSKEVTFYKSLIKSILGDSVDVQQMIQIDLHTGLNEY